MLPFGFSYLSSEQQPSVEKVLVDGVASLNFTLGAVVTLKVRNFDEIDSVKVFIGPLEVSQVTFVTPICVAGLSELKVMVDWKGWSGLVGWGS
eukprot:symbB.v1.2.039523.t1/scaffold6624.1/size16626/1